MAFNNNIGIDDFSHLQIDLVLGECGRVEVNYWKVEFKLQPSTKVCFLVNSFESDHVENTALNIRSGCTQIVKFSDQFHFQAA